MVHPVQKGAGRLAGREPSVGRRVPLHTQAACFGLVAFGQMALRMPFSRPSLASEAAFKLAPELVLQTGNLPVGHAPFPLPILLLSVLLCR